MTEPITDAQLVERIIKATVENTIEWEKTATVDQFTSIYAGKWTLLIDKSPNPGNEDVSDYWLALSNAKGDELLRVYDSRVPRLYDLFELARRKALKVNEAVADFIKDLDDDVPF